ncbi:aminoacyl-tRNA hydrolase [Bartonella sp. LJL80]
MLLIVGLGNPGAQYQNNRHNIGFMAVDEIQQAQRFSPWSKKFQADISDGSIGGEKYLLMKPQTFMNLSGQAVGEAIRFYKLSLNDLIVIYDELDLAPGKIRIKTGGGSGGHNGIKSIDAHCGNAYRRVRLGIGHPGAKELVHNHVLGNFSKGDQDWLYPLLKSIGENITMLGQGDDNSFMNKVALALGNGDQRKLATEKNAVPKPAKSHIRQARENKKVELPQSGPMADMLKRLFKKD